MFESVAPENFVPRSRKVFYESLPMSIATHAVLAAALVVGGTWNVTFPIESPRLHLAYSIALAPTPPPPPPAPARTQVAPKPVQPEERTAPPPDEIVAPAIIPDEIPIVETMAAVEGSVGEGNAGEAVVKGWISSDGGGVGSEDAVGVPAGVPGGVQGGMGEGPPDTLVLKRHQTLPTMMTPMSMVYPFYPEEARVRGWEDAVAVRYVIGKDGRVKSVEVIEKPEREVFQKSVVHAIRHWRFRPLVKAGVPQEVIHELVIYFKLNA
jgi:TonB family protein